MSEYSIELKSTKYVLTLVMDPSASFSRILDDVNERFRKSARFFKGASMALEFSGKELSSSQKEEIIRAIRSGCGMDITCVIEEDKEKEDAQYKAVTMAMLREDAEKEGHSGPEDSSRRGGWPGVVTGRAEVIAGSIKNGQKISSDKTVLLLGDVEPGGSVESSESIFVAGCVMGTLRCGLDPDNHGTFAAALVLKPSELEISGHKSVSAIRKRTMDESYKPFPQVCSIQDGHMKLEPISGRTWSHLFEKLSSAASETADAGSNKESVVHEREGVD